MPKKKADFLDIIAYLIGSAAIVITTIAILFMLFGIEI
jgi:hypothetical protein